MSLLSRDEVSISLAPRRLGVIRRARGVRNRIVATAEAEVPLAPGGDPSAVLARLASVLADPVWHGAAARVVFADQAWARYAVMPGAAVALDAPTRLAQARLVLADAFGEAVSDWTVTLSDAPPGARCVACATQAGLRRAIEEALAPARLTLRSLQPRLVAAFNAFRRQLPPGDSWFVSLDEDSVAAAQVCDGAWSRIHVGRAAADSAVELGRLRAFGRITSGATPRFFVHAPAWLRRTAAQMPGVEWLDPGDLQLLQRISA